MTIRRFLKDDTGVTTLELALALPLLATLMVGILQAGMLMHTNGGLRHAIGEGLRYAKVNPGASEEQVETYTREAFTGIDTGGLTAIDYTRGMQNGADFGRLSITYQAQPVIPFVPAQLVTLSETKQVYFQN